jgi:hypothetical protein
MAKWEPDNNLLQNYCTQHLPYELDMLAQTYEQLNVTKGRVLVNALIESFCIHARNLIEFYRGKSDVHASHFTSSKYKPKYVAANANGLGNTLYAKLNQQIAHMSKDRTTDPKKKIGPDDRTKIIQALRLEEARFRSCLNEGCEVGRPIENGVSLNINAGGTPSTSSTFTTASFSSR